MPYKDKAKAAACIKAAYRKRHLREFVNGSEQQRERWREQIRSQNSRKPPARRRQHIKERYGLTLEQWDVLFEAQDRCCAICKGETSGWRRGWHTDHDHKTGKVRGILCHSCNRLLGHVKDDVSRLRTFIEYLEPK